MRVNKVLYYLKRALNQSPNKTIIKAKTIISLLVRNKIAELKFRLVPTYAPDDVLPLGELFSYFEPLNFDERSQFIEILTPFLRRTMRHEFDLLGSDWTKIYYGMHANGICGVKFSPRAGPDDKSKLNNWISNKVVRSNRQESKQIRALICKDYCPIDWHLDFKSGYRWSERTFAKKIQYGHKLGVDVKVPWELGRLQHLPQLALGAVAGGIDGEFEPDELKREFQNQFLDFVAANPPGYGVNWCCTMDVAIRGANIAIAYDLFISNNFEFDEKFKSIIKRSLYEHANHIVNNLEWHPDLRGNHYLADICGLLIVTTFLPLDPKINCWLAFSVQQLKLETLHQFSSDGANFEASTCYHLLSSQMVSVASAFCLALRGAKKDALTTFDGSLWHLSQPRLMKKPLPLFPRGKQQAGLFDREFVNRLYLMEKFAGDMTKPSGSVVQIGDNDSGRFLKLIPCEIDNCGRETLVDPTSVRATIQSIFGELNKEMSSIPIAVLESKIFNSLRSISLKRPTVLIQKPQFLSSLDIDDVANKTYSRRIIIKIDGESLLKDLQVISYPDFGFYLWRSERLWASIRCGPIGQDGNGGHAHNDQLSMELVVDGKDWVTDPGSYLYTPFPEIRNAYRSCYAHFVPELVVEPSEFRDHLFSLENNTNAKCFCFSDKFFAGSHDGNAGRVMRKVSIAENEIIVEDQHSSMVNSKHTRQVYHASTPGELNKFLVSPVELSLGYGILRSDLK